MGMAAAGVGRLARLRSGGKYTQRSINRIRTALLAAFITLLVVRATIGINRLAYSGAVSVVSVSDRATAATTKLAEDIDREIRADSDDLDDADDSTTTSEYHHAGASWSPDYRLGPRVTRWNAQRRRWLHQNPGFPSRDARGNERVLLVTSSSSPTTGGPPCATALGDHLLLRAVKNKLDYCRLHGIDLSLHDTSSSRGLDGEELTGPSWSKLPLLRRLMLAHPETEWLWWLDAGAAAVITDMGFDLPLDRYVGINLVVHGHQDRLFDGRSWAAVSTASFLLRNCQWSLDLLDAWATMGPKGRVRQDAGKLLSATLTGRPPALVEADDQSALVHLLLTEKELWTERVYIDNEYHLRQHWTKLVDKYEDIAAKHHPGYGDDRWPFVTHFAGCNPCLGGGGKSKKEEYYAAERCVRGMERALNFADNQVLRLYGFEHPALQASAEVRRVANRSADPLQAKEEAIAYLKKPKDPPAPKKESTTREERLERKRLAKSSKSVLARVLRKLGW